MDDDVECLLVRVVGVDGGTHEGSFSGKVTAMYVSTYHDELVYDVLATKGCGKVKGRVALVVEDGVHVEWKGRIRCEFTEEIKDKSWIILSAYGSDELCTTCISENRGIAQKGWFCGEAERERVCIYTIH